jgi:hypothetical protein
MDARNADILQPMLTGRRLNERQKNIEERLPWGKR